MTGSRQPCRLRGGSEVWLRHFVPFALLVVADKLGTSSIATFCLFSRKSFLPLNSAS